MDDLQKQSLTEHLRELRQCLVTSLVATAAGFAIAYYFSDRLGEWLFRPLFATMPRHAALIFTSYQEGFFFT